MEQSVPTSVLVEGVLYEQRVSGIFYRTTYSQRAYRVELLTHPEIALRLRLAKRVAPHGLTAQSAGSNDTKGGTERTAVEIAAEVDAEAMDEQFEDVEGAGGRGDDLIIHAVVGTQSEPKVQLPIACNSTAVTDACGGIVANNSDHGRAGSTDSAGGDGFDGNVGGGGINATLLGWFGGSASCGEGSADPDAAPLLPAPDDNTNAVTSQVSVNKDACRSAASVVVECTSFEEWSRALRYAGTPARGKRRFFTRRLEEWELVRAEVRAMALGMRANTRARACSRVQGVAVGGGGLLRTPMSEVPSLSIHAPGLTSSAGDWLQPSRTTSSRATLPSIAATQSPQARSGIVDVVQQQSSDTDSVAGLDAMLAAEFDDVDMSVVSDAQAKSCTLRPGLGPGAHPNSNLRATVSCSGAVASGHVGGTKCLESDAAAKNLDEGLLIDEFDVLDVCDPPATTMAHARSGVGNLEGSRDNTLGHLRLSSHTPEKRNVLLPVGDFGHSEVGDETDSDDGSDSGISASRSVPVSAATEHTTASQSKGSAAASIAAGAATGAAALVVSSAASTAARVAGMKYVMGSRVAGTVLGGRLGGALAAGVADSAVAVAGSVAGLAATAVVGIGGVVASTAASCATSTQAQCNAAAAGSSSNVKLEQCEHCDSDSNGSHCDSERDTDSAADLDSD